MFLKVYFLAIFVLGLSSGLPGPSQVISKRKAMQKSKSDLVKKLSSVFDEMMRKPETNQLFNLIRGNTGEYNFDLDMLIENGGARGGSDLPVENEEVSDVVKRSVKDEKSMTLALPGMKSLEKILDLIPKDFGLNQMNQNKGFMNFMQKRSNERVKREESSVNTTTKTAPSFDTSKIFESMKPMKNMQIFPNPMDSIKGMYEKTIGAFSNIIGGAGAFPKMQPMSPMSFLSPQSMLPPNIGAAGMMPPGMSPGMLPPGMMPPGMIPPGMMPPGIGGSGALPPGISEEDLQKILSGMKNRKRSVKAKRISP